MDLRERAASADHGRVVRHPWERARASYFAAVLGQWAPGAQSILDVGAGDGWLAEQVARAHQPARIVCWDVHYEDGDLGSRAVGSTRIDRVRAEPKERFEAMMLLDVIEHVERDADFLTHLVSDRLAPGGGVLLSVPAWPALYGPHDRFLGHYRRYRPEQLVDVARRAGLEVETSAGLFHGLLPVRAAQVWLERGRVPGATGNESDLQWGLGEGAARVVTAALRVEERLSLFAARRRLRVHGLSTWLFARRSP